MRVLSWNLFHGRSVPGSYRNLLPAFAQQLAEWEWDVALLQEVPPWWPPELARAAGASQRTALTSRNSFLPVRRWLAERFPDIMKSEGGGSNAILARGHRIDQHRIRPVAVTPERRVVHGVQLDASLWVVNLHLTAHHPAQADAERVVARETALRWAGRGAPPIVLGAGGSVRGPRSREALRPRAHPRGTALRSGRFRPTHVGGPICAVSESCSCSSPPSA